MKTNNTHNIITIDNYFDMMAKVDLSKLPSNLKCYYLEFYRLMNSAKNDGGVQSWINGSVSFQNAVNQTLIELNECIGSGLITFDLTIEIN